MPGVEVHEVTWIVTETAREDVAKIRDELGANEYRASVLSLQRTLCGYFSTTEGCASKGMSISPIGSSDDGGKILKVRWGIPGCGKRGGLRMAFVAYCDRCVVVLCRAYIRRDDPSAADFESAAELAAQYKEAGLNDDDDGE